jgi:hypothetical protein
VRVRIILRDGYGDRFGNFHKCGDVVDLPDIIAAKLLKRGMAVAAPPEPVIETAEVAPPRNAARRTTKPRPRRKATN